MYGSHGLHLLVDLFTYKFYRGVALFLILSFPLTLFALTKAIPNLRIWNFFAKYGKGLVVSRNCCKIIPASLKA